MAPRGVNAIMLEKIPSQKELSTQESKQEVTNVIFLVKEGGREINQMYPIALMRNTWKGSHALS